MESNPKRTQILSTGKELFWKFGFRRVTIEEICREAGVSKMTFYKFFSNKKDLASTMLDELFSESLRQIRKIHDDHVSPDETFKKLLHLKSEGSKGISGDFIKDLYSDTDEGLKSYFEEKGQIMFAEIAKVYARGQEEGWVRKDLHIPFFMNYLQRVTELLTEDQMLSFFDDPQDMIMEVTNLFIYGISPRN